MPLSYVGYRAPPAAYGRDRERNDLRGVVDALATRRIASEPDAIAPDGSAVRVLCATSRGGMAVFTLAPGAVSRAVAHRTIEEIWYFLAGSGRMWRKLGDRESVAHVEPGVWSPSRPGRISSSAAMGKRR
jgi:mannose-6-phosphate isomerase-like protein (cupin superfamily)